MSNTMKNENQSGHTAGPWHGETSCVRNVYGANGKYIATAYPTLQDNQTDWEKDSIPEAEANGRLIAAAPDLLSAAKAVLKWAKETGLHGTSAEPSCIDMCEAAIAKAKGQSCPA